MALIKCPECGKEISDKAKTCPNCGSPVSSGQPEVRSVSSSSKNRPKRNSQLGIAALILSILGCTFVIGAIMAVIDLCKKDGNKKTCSIIALVISGLWLVIGVGASAGSGDKSDTPTTAVVSSQTSTTAEETTKSPETEMETESEEGVKDKYCVGDTWENKTLKMTYTNCYEFTDYNEYNAPSEGNKIICAEFEFENIGKSDTTVMYTDFNGYADGYEVEQSYAPDGTGLDFSVSMSSGRKGTGKIAFEVPVDSQEVEIEFSPNMFSSEKVIFIYK